VTCRGRSQWVWIPWPWIVAAGRLCEKIEIPRICTAMALSAPGSFQSVLGDKVDGAASRSLWCAQARVCSWRRAVRRDLRCRFAASRRVLGRGLQSAGRDIRFTTARRAPLAHGGNGGHPDMGGTVAWRARAHRRRRKADMTRSERHRGAGCVTM